MQWVKVSGEAAWEIQRSRFIGLLVPLPDPDPQPTLEAIRARFRDANHHCYAWRWQGQERADDAGEPAGTAGLPLLETLRRHDVERALLVAIRYFGGVRLGRAGLYRAYHETGRRALEQAQLARPEPIAEVAVTLTYPVYQLWARRLAATEHEEMVVEFGALVSWRGRLRLGDWQALEASLGHGISVETVHVQDALL
jgi:putative IMPACT (imprinted ancient) family translation regulator